MARALEVEITGDASSYSRSLKRAANDTNRFNRELSKVSRGALAGTGAFQSLGRSLAFASGAFLGTASLSLFLKNSVTAASNLAEQTNKVNVVFGKSAHTIDAWGKTTANSIGIANDQALEAAGTFGNLLTTVGVLPAQNAKMSRSLVQLAADLASFNNASPEDTLLAIRSGLVGEAEPLRKFGVLLSETRVQQEAMAETGKKNVRQLTAQDKVLARYTLILRDTKVAQGDFSRTADGLANSQRTLSAEIRDTEAAIGTALLPTVGKITRAFRDWLAKPENQKKIQDTTEKTVGFLGQMAHQAKMVGDQFATAAGKINDAAEASRRLNDQIAKNLGLAKQQQGTGFIPGGAGFIPGGFGDFFENRAGNPPRRRRTAAAPAAAPPGPLGFTARFARLDLALAKAELTQQQKDDRAILVQQAALIRERLKKVQTVKDLTALNRQLGSIQDQIGRIDDEAAQKQLEARQKAADKAKAQAAKLKAQAAAVKAQLQSALDSAITQMGQLFEVFVPDDPAKGILGVIGGGVSAKSLTARLKAQNDQAAKFANDLKRLRRRGAPPALVDALAAQGLAGAQNVHALATSNVTDWNRFLRQYARRQRVAQQIAHADIRAKTVYINTGRIHSSATSVSQRRSRNAGVPLNQSSLSYGPH